MNYTKKSFSVGALPTEKYRSEWERIFRPIGGAKLGEVDDHGLCDHCKTEDVDLYTRNHLFLCAKCAGIVS